jgi:predicted MPP superfamily phosphohydrolase
MNAPMLRMLGLTIGLVTLGEVLIVHWALLASGDGGLSPLAGVLCVAGIGAANALVFPWIRRRIRARGLLRVLSRTWIFGSIGALFSGVLLAALFGVTSLTGASSGPGADPQAALVWLGGAAVALGFGSIAWGISVGTLRVRVDRISLPLRGATPSHEALRIAHVTDLHIGPLLEAERLAGFVERINRLEPDLVVMTGDLFDFDPAYVEAGCRELAKLEGRHGVFAVLGNHDVYTGTDTVAAGLLDLTSVRLLRDEWEQVELRGGALAIAGIEDTGEGWTERESEHHALDRLAREIPAELPRLLLAHRPSWFGHAARLGFPLVLAGHTHGGQVAPPFAHHWNPSRMISHRTRGIFRHEGSTLYVSRGLGMAGLPLRINCPREIALIELDGTLR